MIIPSVAMTLSLLGTFGFMSLFGFSLDNLSLMALTIATGFVVDDAIVVLENITRHIEAGMKPIAAAFQGAQEVGFTVLSDESLIDCRIYAHSLYGGNSRKIISRICNDPIASDFGFTCDFFDCNADDVLSTAKTPEENSGAYPLFSRRQRSR